MSSIGDRRIDNPGGDEMFCMQCSLECNLFLALSIKRSDLTLDNNSILPVLVQVSSAVGVL